MLSGARRDPPATTIAAGLNARLARRATIQ
jgi:hypothetical protein